MSYLSICSDDSLHTTTTTTTTTITTKFAKRHFSGLLALGGVFMLIFPALEERLNVATFF